MTTNGCVVSVRGLHKAFRVGFWRHRRKAVLQDVCFEVSSGEILGYLGPNGSGKTTTLKILIGLIRADQGDARILERDVRDAGWKYRAGYLPEHPYFYDYLTAREYMDYSARLFGLSRGDRSERVRELLELVGLSRSAEIALRRYSKGMLQRLGVAQALINDPEVLFLDEPMSGLDPVGRRLVRNVILDLKRRGKAVLFSTHILSDAEALCDRVVLLRAGRVVAQGRVDDILALDVEHLEVLASGAAQLDNTLEAPIKKRTAMGDRVRFEVDQAELSRLIATLERQGARVISVHPVRQSLEEYFLEEMRRHAGEGSWPMEE